MDNENCYHCGLDIAPGSAIMYDDKAFCCTGCKTVYEIFSTNGLDCYYDLQQAPGATPQELNGKYDFLDNKEIAARLLEFNEQDTNIITLQIPHIHCSSCIWILENMNRLNEGISSSQVNFPQKKVRIVFNPDTISLKQVVTLLSSIGYEPYISLENYDVKRKGVNRELTYKLGVAFFCFGNVMLLSFPEYFDVDEYWLEQYKGFFRWLIFALSLPSFIYAASGYYISAYKSLRAGMLNIDVPIALGLVVMFVRSTADIIFNLGQGFFDSLTGLVFFMLLGRLFQQKTYNFLSFERDFKSYFPVAVTRITGGREESVPVYDVAKGDRLLIRNQELIPVDGILISDNTDIDYSFVTGEAIPIHKKSGDKIFAGGKQMGQIIEMEVVSAVSQSYLTQLWSNDVFAKKTNQDYKTLTDTISRYFTPAILILAFITFGFWAFTSFTVAINAFTAILIVACPCALALSAPFTLGNVLRIMGKKKFYLKNATVIEQMAKIDTIVFDKTGTITTSSKSDITYHGETLSDEELTALSNILRGSNHPLSRRLYEFLPETSATLVSDYGEQTGKGVMGRCNGIFIQAGSAEFIGTTQPDSLKTHVHIAVNGVAKGYFVFNNRYRDGISILFRNLGADYKLAILSGDNEGEKETLQQLLPKGTKLVFNQKPEQKLEYIKALQEQGRNVMMVGDGLNDAGALAQSNVGVSISENVNVFSPACDGILDAAQFGSIDYFLKYSKNAVTTIKLSFALSLAYNAVGLSFAILGKLSPLTAAILMPLSTITIVSFVTLCSNYFATKNKMKKTSEKDEKYVLA